MQKEKDEKRFESYPKPTETDLQLRDQPEFIETEGEVTPNNMPIHPEERQNKGVDEGLKDQNQGKES